MKAKRNLDVYDSDDHKRAVQFLNTLSVEALWTAAQERIKAKQKAPALKVIQGGLK